MGFFASGHGGFFCFVLQKQLFTFMSETQNKVNFRINYEMWQSRIYMTKRNKSIMLENIFI